MKTKQVVIKKFDEGVLVVDRANEDSVYWFGFKPVYSRKLDEFVSSVFGKDLSMGKKISDIDTDVTIPTESVLIHQVLKDNL